MKTKRSLQIFAFIGVLALAALACAIPGLGGSGEPTATPTYVVPTIDPFGSLPSSTPFGGVAAIVSPTATSAASLGTPTPPPVGANCVEGNWSLDMRSVVSYITASFAGRGITEYSVSKVNGDVSLTLENGRVDSQADNFNIVMLNLVSGNETGVSLSGDGSGVYDVNELNIKFTDLNYSATGVIDNSLTTFSLDLNGLLSFAKEFGFDVSIDSLVADRSINYTCFGNSITFQINQFGSLSFSKTTP